MLFAPSTINVPGWSCVSDGKTYSITNQVKDTTQAGFTHSKFGNYGILYLNEISGTYKYIANNAKVQELTTTVTDDFE